MDVRVKKKHTFNIIAVALGGHTYTTGRRSLEYKCFPNFDIFPGTGFQTYYKLDLGDTGQTQTLQFPDFTTNHPHCDVLSYDLDSDSVLNVVTAPTNGIQWLRVCPLCKEVSVTRDAIGVRSFWIVVYAEEGISKSFQVSVEVTCGFEIIRPNSNDLITTYARDDSPTPVPVNI